MDQEMKAMITQILDKVNSLNKQIIHVERSITRLDEKLERMEHRMEFLEQRSAFIEDRILHYETQENRHFVVLEKALGRTRDDMYRMWNKKVDKEALRQAAL